MASDEVSAATGAAPSAAEQLDMKRSARLLAIVKLADAELRGDVPRTVQLEDEIGVLDRIIEKLQTRAQIESASEARDEAVELREKLLTRYTAARDGLAPNLEQARKAIAAATTAAKECSTTWAAGARLWYEIRVLEYRFNLGEAPLEALPIAPVAALTEMFGDEVERSARMSVKQPLPIYSSSASDSAEQIAVNKMVAAHNAVSMLGKDLRLTSELLGLFKKAGTPDVRVVVPSDPAHIGEPAPQMQLPPGAMASALHGYGIPDAAPLSEREEAELARNHRNTTRRQAATLRAESEREQAERNLLGGKKGLR